MKPPIYLDYNGTTPHDPEVIEAMRPFFETEFGNPSSSHWYGIKPKKAVERARGQVAALLGCSAGEVVFTSGGTESNNQAIQSFGGANFANGTHIVTSRIEHPAVLEVCRFMEAHGFSVTYLPVDGTGRVAVSDVEAALRADTVLISIMHANNEVGTVQPIAEISKIAEGNGILFHTDAAQSLGKIPTSVDKLGVGLLSVAGHKLYAPKGVGALYIREGVSPKVLCHGAGQERGLRAGTENVLEIVGLGKACEVAGRDLERNCLQMAAMRDRLETSLRSQLQDIRFNGHPDHRLPNTTSVSFRDLEADRILEEIGPKVAASAGAACHAERVQISHVLEAMNIAKRWAKGTLRFTTGKMTTTGEIDRAVEVIVAAVEKLRKAD